VWGFWFVDDTGYRRLEDDAAVPRPGARVAAPRWRPGVPLLLALLVSLAIWAGIIVGVIRFWRWL
jgi:hypothetical protein